MRKAGSLLARRSDAGARRLVQFGPIGLDQLPTGAAGLICLAWARGRGSRVRRPAGGYRQARGRVPLLSRSGRPRRWIAGCRQPLCEGLPHRLTWREAPHSDEQPSGCVSDIRQSRKEGVLEREKARHLNPCQESLLVSKTSRDPRPRRHSSGHSVRDVALRDGGRYRDGWLGRRGGGSRGSCQLHP